jgi:hypothetical protein
VKNIIEKDFSAAQQWMKSRLPTSLGFSNKAWTGSNRTPGRLSTE